MTVIVQSLLFFAIILQTNGRSQFEISPSNYVFLNQTVDLTCTFSNTELGANFYFNKSRVFCSLEPYVKSCKKNFCTEYGASCQDQKIFRVNRPARLEWNNTKLFCNVLGGNDRSNSIAVYVANIPANPPYLLPLTSTETDIGSTITLQCSLSLSANYAMYVEWFWKCGATELENGIINTGVESKLMIIATKGYNQIQCWCSARIQATGIDIKRVSTFQNITVFYAPEKQPSMMISPNPVIEGEVVTLKCLLEGGGNPRLNVSVSCNNRILSSGTETNGTFSYVILSLHRNDTYRMCNCLATSTRQSLMYTRTSNSERIIVHFPVEIILVELTHGQHEIYNTVPFEIQVHLKGNPASTIKWLKKQENKVLSKISHVATTNTYRVDNSSCLDTGTYTVTASNGIGEAVSRDINVSVICPPFLLVKPTEEIHVQLEGLFTYTIQYTGNPRPDVTFQFVRADNETKYLRNGYDNVTVEHYSLGEVRYTSLLHRYVVTEDELGTYVVKIRNPRGTLRIQFEVLFENERQHYSNFSIAAACTFLVVLVVIISAAFSRANHTTRQANIIRQTKLYVRENVEHLHENPYANLCQSYDDVANHMKTSLYKTFPKGMRTSTHVIIKLELMYMDTKNTIQ